MVVTSKGPTGDPALEASIPAAITGRSGDLGDVRSGEGIVAPFTSAVVRAMMSLSGDGNAGSGT
jgi:hypothetical protein